MLVLSPEIERKTSCLAARAEAGHVVEAFLIRSAVVVDDSLAKMKAIAQRRACYAVQPGIDTLQLHMRLAWPIRLINIRLKFLLQGVKDRTGFIIVVDILDLVAGL